MRWLIEIFLTVFECSLRMSFVMIFLLIGRSWFFRRYTAKWQYYIWIVVLLGLVTPFKHIEPIIKIDMGSHNQVGFASNTLQKEAILPVLNTNLEENDDNVPEQAYNIVPILALGWSMVGIAFFVWNILIHRRFIHTIERWSKPCLNSKIIKEVTLICQNLNMKICPIKVCEVITTPMMVGILKPVIYFPSTIDEEGVVTSILKHELIHIKRCDLIYKMGVLVVTCLHWFNPLVHAMRHIINNNCEISCDEAVVRYMTEEEKRSYGEAILNLAKYNIVNRNKDIKETVLLLGFNGGKNVMKKRMKTIMNSKKKNMGVMACGVILTCSALVTVFVGCGDRDANPGLKTQTVVENKVAGKKYEVSVAIPKAVVDYVKVVPRVEPFGDKSEYTMMSLEFKKGEEVANLGAISVYTIEQYEAIKSEGGPIDREIKRDEKLDVVLGFSGLQDMPFESGTDGEKLVSEYEKGVEDMLKSVTIAEKQ